MRRFLSAAALAGLFAIAGASPAAAADLLRTNVGAASAVDRSCTQKQLSGGSGYAQRTVRMPSAGAVEARLTAASGDWDLAVFEADTGQVVAGSAYSGSREVASGFAIAGERLVVQACRLSGSASSAGLSVQSFAIDTSNVQRSQLARVSTPTLERRNELVALGLDSTEHGGPGYLEVVLHGADDARRLREAGFQWTLEVPDLAVQARRDRAADMRFAAATAASTEFPSGQDTYRRLFDYSEDMKRLAREHPDLVRSVTLNHLTHEGRPVEGIELATNPNARDGRPVFVQMGLHHAREWPSGEHAMEWAYELILGYRRGEARARSALESTRTIVVPVVNPDGFNASREAGQLYMNGDGADTDLDGSGDISDPEFILAAATHPNEYRRKNCAFPEGEGGSCLQPTTGIVGFGTDPNRNYGAFWGGPGSSNNPLTQTYHGAGPFSEPETQNVRELVSSRQVTTLITNHTFSNLVLRPPGLASQGLAPDEPALKALGDSMAAENGYTSQYGWQLYDTTGTTEDWSYSATGGFGYTFEIGDLGFHPPFAETLAEWNGTTDDATGGGNREAFWKAQAHTASAANHSLLTGRAPANAVLRLTKTFETPTFDGSTFTDTLDTTMQVGSNGQFTWHTNPSTRPLVMKQSGRPATGDPSPPQEFESRGGTVPCANFDTPPPSCYEDHVIDVPSGAGIDNAKATVRIEFSPVSDWDMKIYRADASGAATGDPIATSGNGATNGALGVEEATLLDPAGSYVVRVINYAAVDPWSGTVTFAGPDAPGATEETWTLLCEQPEGTIRSARQVFVRRGERRSIDLRNHCRIRR